MNNRLGFVTMTVDESGDSEKDVSQGYYANTSYTMDPLEVKGYSQDKKGFPWWLIIVGGLSIWSMSQ